jgi:hypothetical protein
MTEHWIKVLYKMTAFLLAVLLFVAMLLYSGVPRVVRADGEGGEDLDYEYRAEDGTGDDVQDEFQNENQEGGDEAQGDYLTINFYGPDITIPMTYSQIKKLMDDEYLGGLPEAFLADFDEVFGFEPTAIAPGLDRNRKIMFDLATRFSGLRAGHSGKTVNQNLVNRVSEVNRAVMNQITAAAGSPAVIRVPRAAVVAMVSGTAAAFAQFGATFEVGNYGETVMVVPGNVPDAFANLGGIEIVGFAHGLPVIGSQLPRNIGSILYFDVIANLAQDSPLRDVYFFLRAASVSEIIVNGNIYTLEWNRHGTPGTFGQHYHMRVFRNGVNVFANHVANGFLSRFDAIYYYSFFFVETVIGLQLHAAGITGMVGTDRIVNLSPGMSTAPIAIISHTLANIDRVYNFTHYELEAENYWDSPYANAWRLNFQAGIQNPAATDYFYALINTEGTHLENWYEDGILHMQTILDFCEVSGTVTIGWGANTFTLPLIQHTAVTFPPDTWPGIDYDRITGYLGGIRQDLWSLERTVTDVIRPMEYVPWILSIMFHGIRLIRGFLLKKFCCQIFG